MKLILISIGRLPWYRKGEKLFFFYTPRLGLPYIAAVTPPEWETHILDGVQVEDVDFNEQADLVGFSVLTPFAVESYRAADAYRRLGVTVVMGGVHPTLMPEEAAGHCDAVVTGEGDEIWPRLLADFSAGRLKKFYTQETPVDFASLPGPKFSAIRNTGGYSVANGLQIVRGCPRGGECGFCVVSRIFGNKHRTMPIDRVVREIESRAEDAGSSGINVSASCAMNHTPYIRAFAEAVKPLKIRWSGGALLHGLDVSLFGKFKASGCEYIYTETGVPSQRKDPGKYNRYREIISRLHDNGIEISYNFTVGLDTDTRDVFEEVMSFIDENNLQTRFCAIQLFVPWPGTDVHKRVEKEGRITDRDWSHYDNTRAVFRPKLMSVKEFESHGKE
ncbi:MAG: cobalamin-dependent protein [Kiritimatiellia bacterium]